ncbi:MAG: YHYH protein [Flavobacteriales bacterium]|nr:YHYH protein [Flavobacteriales bacterium]
MRHHPTLRTATALLPLFLACPLAAQDPLLTSWIINPGGQTGYAGIATNVESVYHTATDVYVSSTCIPGYDIGPWTANPNLPANQDFTFKITRNPVENTGNPVNTPLGHIGVWRNGVSIFNARDGMSYNNQGVWNRDALVWEGISFDDCLGHAAGNGEYHHHVSPNCLYFHLNDEVHSDLIGYAFDGFPIYGAHAFANTDGTGGITRMRSSYQLRTITDRSTLPNGTVLPVNQHGPAIDGQYPLGAFIEDYAFVSGSGDLDVHNGRFCITPDHPGGTYAYFVTLNEQYLPAYPYVLGPAYHGTVQAGNTGPQSGHNTIPGNAVLYDPLSTGMASRALDQLELYPVPTSGLLWIQSNDTPVRQVDVLDALGRSVLRTNHTETMVSMDLHALPVGSYQARITTADGRVQVRPFVRN